MYQQELQYHQNDDHNTNNRTVITKLEADECLFETGKDYQNFPQRNYQNNPMISSLSN
jgi:hypothetical protein